MENQYELKYRTGKFYWGIEPTRIARKAVEFYGQPADINTKALDLGCGECRDLLFLAKNGFESHGFDITSAGFEKAHLLASEENIKIKTFTSDIIHYIPDCKYDLIISSGALQYLPYNIRNQKFNEYKNATNMGGLNALMAFIKKPFITPAPDSESTAHDYFSGELFSYYNDWEILYCDEIIFDCMSSGTPHKHAANYMVAKKI